MSFEKLRAEDCYQNEPLGTLAPEMLYDQKWASSLVERVIAGLEAEYSSLGKRAVFGGKPRVAQSNPRSEIRFLVVGQLE